MIAVVVIQFVILAVLLLCSAFFSSAETALFSLNPIQIHRLRKEHAAAAVRIERLLAKPSRLLSSILIGNTLVNIFSAAIGFLLAEHFAPGRGEAVSIAIMTVLLLVFCEVTPKRLAMSRAESLACAYSLVLPMVEKATAPFRFVLDRIAGFVSGYMGTPRRGLTEDELLSVVEVGEEEGVLDEEERIMVDGIIRLEEIQASDVMTPRVDIVGIDLDDDVEESKSIAGSVTYRYLPVFRGSPDNIVGFLDVPKFMLSTDHDLENAVIQPFFVPETATLDSLLTLLQKEHKRIAVVADEYGGTAGLITRGDILEEIVADVDNEYGKEKLTIEKVAENRWMVEGSVSLEDINYELDMNLEAEGADRISGWVAAQTGRIPKPGDVVEAQNCRATVQRVRRNRITLVLLEKINPPMEEVET